MVFTEGGLEHTSLSAFDQAMSRRTFLKAAGVAALTLASSEISDQKEVVPTMIHFPKSQVGVNLHLAGIRGFGLNEAETVKQMFAMRLSRVRIPIPWDEVEQKKGVWDFAKRRALIQEAKDKGLSVDLQIGIKTIGWPEIHVPKWLYDEPGLSYIAESNVQLDANPDLKKPTEKYLAAVTEQIILPFQDSLATIQVENEPFSKHLEVSRNRHISPTFNAWEREFIRKETGYEGPFVQNVPFDTWRNIPAALDAADIIGFNIYTQHTNKFENPIFKQGYWAGVNALAGLVRVAGKKVRITEFQMAPWLDGNRKPVSTFTLEGIVDALQHVQEIDPEEGIYQWDVEQILAMGTDEHKQFAFGMAT